MATGDPSDIDTQLETTAAAWEIDSVRTLGRPLNLPSFSFADDAFTEETPRKKLDFNSTKWRSRKSNLQALTDLKTRDNQCEIFAAEAIEEGAKLSVISYFVQSISDTAVRDRCCEMTVKSASAKSNWKAVKFLLQTISDPSARDRCCEKAAAIALDQFKWKYFKEITSLIAEHSLRDELCRREAEMAARNMNTAKLSAILDSFASDPTQLDRVPPSLKFEDNSDGSAEDSHDSSELQGYPLDHRKSRKVEMSDPSPSIGNSPIPCHWLERNSSLLALLSHLTISGDNSILMCSIAQMQPAQIAQLLCLSITHGHVALASTLINDKNFSREYVDLPDSTGSTALMLAADAGHHELLKQLLDAGASVRAEDSLGRTALSRACEAGHQRAAKALRDGGADPSNRDARGLTCEQLADQQHQQLPKEIENEYIAQSDIPGEELHQLLCHAGFTEDRAHCQQKLADFLQSITQAITQDDKQMTGSFAEGWANSLMQVNGRTAADSDIDWTVLTSRRRFHLEGGCNGLSDITCLGAERLKVIKGHAQVQVGSGSQPAVSTPASGVRPAQDLCHAIQCCSEFGRQTIKKLPLSSSPVHLVRATRPDSSNELRVSFSFQEKQIMRDLNTVQGQLFTIINFIFKRHLPIALNAPGLKTYHAKTLLFFMLEKHLDDADAVWKPQNLIKLLEESLDMMLSFIDSSSSPDECMPHFFLPDAPLYFKNAGIGGDFDKTKSSVRNCLSKVRKSTDAVIERMKRLVRPLSSNSFYFHPFTLLPLTLPPMTREVNRSSERFGKTCADVYSVVYQCVADLQSDSTEKAALINQLSLLKPNNLWFLWWCDSTAICLTAMTHLKYGELQQAEEVLMEQPSLEIVTRGWKPNHIKRREFRQIIWDWACLAFDTPPHFPFLPEFTQTLFTARLSQPRSSHLYVNFRCILWSLQAELLGSRTQIPFDKWFKELQEDPDLEELSTLAHYSNDRKHVEFCLTQMEIISHQK